MPGAGSDTALAMRLASLAGVAALAPRPEKFCGHADLGVDNDKRTIYSVLLYLYLNV